MWVFYLIALLPTFVSIAFWLLDKKVNWWESLIAVMIAFATSGIIHVAVIDLESSDVETWSGRVDHVYHMPRWEEEYQESVYITVNHSDGSTSRQFSHYQTKYRWHGPDWDVICDFGTEKERFSISQQKYNELIQKFGKQKSIKGDRDGYNAGDRNDYVSVNVTGWIEPVTTNKYFENRIKASKTLFSHIQVPENMDLFNYPQNPVFNSNRLVGSSGRMISILEFDRLNTLLGPTKKVNLIMVGFPPNSDPMLAQYLEARWVGGKKNDLVMCYSLSNKLTADWSYVFGWTEEEIVKRNLESLLLQHEISDKILEPIKTIVTRDYIIKDWSKFDYISINPPMWSYYVLIFVTICIQTVYLLWARKNEFEGRLSIIHD